MEKPNNVAVTAKMLFYNLNASERSAIKARILKRIGITSHAFYSRLRGETAWKKLEKEVFAEEFNLPVEDISI